MLTTSERRAQIAHDRAEKRAADEQRLLAELEAARVAFRSHSKPAANPDWLHIESAPKDGTKIDVWFVTESGQEGRYPDAFYRDGRWLAECCGYDEPGECESEPWVYTDTHMQRHVRWCKLTHWRPVPSSPTSPPACLPRS